MASQVAQPEPPQDMAEHEVDGTAVASPEVLPETVEPIISLHTQSTEAPTSHDETPVLKTQPALAQESAPAPHNSLAPTEAADDGQLPASATSSVPLTSLTISVSEFAEEQDFLSEPLESRFASKDLSRRCSAYAEAQEKMKAKDDESVFELFKANIDTCIGEALPKGQDAALSALVVYLECSSALEADGVLTLVRRLLEHKAIDKPKMQQLVPPVILAATEMCECPGVVKELLENLASVENAKKKTQGLLKKQVAFLIKLAHQLLESFGAQKMSPKLGYLAPVIKYITDKELSVREACYGVLVELSCWMGDIGEFTKALEEPQKKEIAKRLADMSEAEKERSLPKRHYRGEDPTTLVAKKTKACDAIKKLPSGWCITKVFSMEKWKEKQEYLQLFSSAIDVQQLTPSEGYVAMLPSLQRLLKTESNIAIVTEVAKCIGLLARGLRRDFERQARQLLPLMLVKIQDKSLWKQNVLIERVEQLLWSLPYETMMEELRTYIAGKSPFAKKEAMSLLSRAMGLPQVEELSEDSLQRSYPALVEIALPIADDGDSFVRLEAARLLAAVALRNSPGGKLSPEYMFERLPGHRRNTFAEEWRKISNGRPLEHGNAAAAAAAADACSTYSPASASKQPVRRSTPQRSRSADETRSAESAQAQSGRPTPRTSRPNSPGKMQQGNRSRPGQSQSSERAASAQGERTKEMTLARAPSVEEVMAFPLVQQMAEELRSLREECRHLRSSVESLQAASAERTTPPAAPADVDSSGVPQAQEETPATPVRQSSPARQPRKESPVRQLTRDSPVRQLTRVASPAGGRVPRPASPLSRRAESPMQRSMSQERRLKAAPRKLTHVSTADGGGLSARQSTSSTGSAGREAPTPTALVIYPPRQPKHVRQMRERSQNWGPEPIAPKLSAALRDQMQTCMEETLWKAMFSGRTEDQVTALNLWKSQVLDHIPEVIEILDMVLKWLTLMFASTSVQVWRTTQEAITTLFEGLSSSYYELTEREALVLVPILIERSGHNMESLREGMVVVLQQLPRVFPHMKLLPLLLNGLCSRSRRSVMCTLRALTACMDAQVATALARSQKDITFLINLNNDKDTDVRAHAAHCFASMSQYLDPECFHRLSKLLSKPALQAVQAIQAKLRPMPVDAPVEQWVEKPPKVLQQPASTNSTTPAPAKSARLIVGSVKTSSDPVARQLVAPPPLDVAATKPEAPPSVAQLAQSLAACDGPDFQAACETIQHEIKKLDSAMLLSTSPILAQAMLAEMRRRFRAEGSSDQMEALAMLLEDTCGLREFVRPLPEILLKEILREFLWFLDCSWIRHNGVLSKRLNLSCVMLLNSMHRPMGYAVLLELGVQEPDMMATSLVAKCLQKLHKKLPECLNTEQEVLGILDAVCRFVQNVEKRLPRIPADGLEKFQTRVLEPLMEAAREAAEIAQRASPEAASAWVSRNMTNKESKLLTAAEAARMQELLGFHKENLPVQQQPSTQRLSSGGIRRASSPAKRLSGSGVRSFKSLATPS